VSQCRDFAPRLLQMMAILVGGLCAGHATVSCAQSMNDANEPCAKIVSTAEMSGCFDKAYKAADRELNELYGRIQKVLHPDELASLVQAERRWLQYRDATCKAEYKLFGGGTAGPPTRLACLTAETRARQASLSRSYEWRLEKFGG
jgi:uncharacterized protein YecT (DUF1311 family)